VDVQPRQASSEGRWQPHAMAEPVNPQQPRRLASGTRRDRVYRSSLDRAAAITWPGRSRPRVLSSESVKQLLPCLGHQLHAGDGTEPHERPLLLSQRQGVQKVVQNVTVVDIQVGVQQ
jgi:hypothetical protein